MTKSIVFKNENAFKRWLAKFHYKQYKCYYIESKNTLGFPDVVCAPVDKRDHTLFFEAKYIRENFDREKSYEIPYRPKQHQTLKSLENYNTICEVAICFLDCYVITGPNIFLDKNLGFKIFDFYNREVNKNEGIG